MSSQKTIFQSENRLWDKKLFEVYKTVPMTDLDPSFIDYAISSLGIIQRSHVSNSTIEKVIYALVWYVNVWLCVTVVDVNASN